MTDYRLNAIPEFVTQLRVTTSLPTLSTQVIEIQLDQPYSELPKSVPISKITLKVLQSLKLSAKRRRYFQQYCKTESMDEKFQRYLNLPQHKAVVSDCFWYVLAKFFKTEDGSASMLERRMSENYINLMLSIRDKNDNELFFRDYFDIVSQSVYYGFTIAYPKQIEKFDEDFRLILIKTISKLFSGIDISKPSIYLDKWILVNPPVSDEKQRDRNGNKSLPPIRYSKTMNKREQASLRYSPIVELYLSTYKYKTKNTIPEFRMKYSKLPVNNKKYKDLQLLKIKNESGSIFQNSKLVYKEDEDNHKKFQQQIRVIQRQIHTFNNLTDKKKAEEIAKGAKKYANKLVVEMNAKLPLTKTFGVIRKAEEEFNY